MDSQELGPLEAAAPYLHDVPIVPHAQVCSYRDNLATAIAMLTLTILSTMSTLGASARGDTVMLQSDDDARIRRPLCLTCRTAALTTSHHACGASQIYWQTRIIPMVDIGLCILF